MEVEAGRRRPAARLRKRGPGRPRSATQATGGRAASDAAQLEISTARAFSGAAQSEVSRARARNFCVGAGGLWLGYAVSRRGRPAS
jgi:hypothetical protein